MTKCASCPRPPPPCSTFARAHTLLRPLSANGTAMRSSAQRNASPSWRENTSNQPELHASDEHASPQNFGCPRYRCFRYLGVDWHASRQKCRSPAVSRSHLLCPSAASRHACSPPVCRVAQG